MKEVKSYQSNDGKLFTNKEDAFEQDLLVALRGVIQSNDRSNVDTITINEAAARLRSKAKEVKGILEHHFTAKQRRQRYTKEVVA